MALDENRSYCSHFASMAWHGKYAACENCEQFWQLTSKGWVPEIDPDDPYCPAPKKQWQNKNYRKKR